MTSSVIFPPIDNYTVTYDIITRNNTRGDNQTERIEEIFHHQLQTTLETYVCPLIYLIGIPGNLLSFALWLMPRMRNSSGCYFATLAISDTIVLLTHMVLTVQVVCEVELLNSPFLCEAFNVLYVSSECWSVLLILGLTVDRYVIICHPMRRQSWCTISRTLKVILSLAMFAILLGKHHLQFHDTESKTLLRNVSLCEHNADSVPHKSISGGKISYLKFKIIMCPLIKENWLIPCKDHRLPCPPLVLQTAVTFFTWVMCMHNLILYSKKGLPLI